MSTQYIQGTSLRISKDKPGGATSLHYFINRSDKESFFKRRSFGRRSDALGSVVRPCAKPHKQGPTLGSKHSSIKPGHRGRLACCGDAPRLCRGRSTRTPYIDVPWLGEARGLSRRGVLGDVGLNRPVNFTRARAIGTLTRRAGLDTTQVGHQAGRSNSSGNRARTTRCRTRAAEAIKDVGASAPGPYRSSPLVPTAG